MRRTARGDDGGDSPVCTMDDGTDEDEEDAIVPSRFARAVRFGEAAGAIEIYALVTVDFVGVDFSLVRTREKEVLEWFAGDLACVRHNLSVLTSR